MSDWIRVFSPLFHPLGLVWLLLLLGTALAARRRQWAVAMVTASGTLLLWFVSQPRVAGYLLDQLEQPWVDASPALAPPADAVVVLGGGWRRSPRDFVGIDLTPSGDRWITGVELCRLGRSTNLVVGGDPLPDDQGTPPDSADLRRWLELWNLHPVHLLSLGPVATTQDEAVAARSLLKQRAWSHVLLVTSAFHMRRALATFESAGVPVTPVACDFQSVRGLAGRRSLGGWTLFPNDDAFHAFNLWWHEQIGWYVYRMLGHVGPLKHHPARPASNTLTPAAPPAPPEPSSPPDPVAVPSPESPETPVPETPAPETPVPETPVPETPVPETPVPETPAPETPAPETPVPETPAPEIPAPETPVPETPVPETPVPETPASEAAQSSPAEPASSPESLAVESGASASYRETRPAWQSGPT